MIKKLINNSSLKINIIFSFMSSAWSSLLSLLFVPIYITYIGPEGYGLIGIFASLQVVLSLLDSGLSTTLNKEIASLSVLSNTKQQICNLVKTLGTIYWFLALIAGFIAMGLSPLIAKYWVNSNDLSIYTITISLILLSMSLVFQLPIGFYSGGLLGLKRQIPLSVINALFGTLKSVGALIILIFISKSIIIFFIWTLIVSIVQAFTLKLLLWHYLPRDINPRFDMSEFRRIFKFAKGMMGISLTAILLTQVDKIILSKILPLDEFGFYTIGVSLSLMIYQIIGPIAQSYFPRFSNLISLNKIDDLKSVYHQACQVVSVFVLPATFVLVFFSEKLIYIWTNNQNTTTNVMYITAIYALGTGLNGLMTIPYHLTLAYSWTKIGFYQNIILLMLIIPLNIILSLNYGAIGGALTWALINGIYFFITPHIIHNRILKGEVSRWYIYDTMIPILICILVMSFSKYFILSTSYGSWIDLFIIITSTIISSLFIFIFSIKTKLYNNF